ncbi:MAG TPA: protein kinase [Gemmatimonadaceae bacterium]|nr:protein kinase [Gemmatimonadaceae bacterium]
MDLRAQLQATLGSAYTLEQELGGGGMSRVFVADETRLSRKVVVKLLSPELAQGISAERFEREIKLAASLQQANIVPVLNAGDSGGLPFYTMPFVEGESLRARLRTSGALPIAQSVSVLRDVARALAYAHDRGIVHRDIKPDNVLLSGGAAVVTDFGIAKAISAARAPADGATLTQLGTSIGTPAYISPEQAAGDPTVDHRADLYSFGCMAYELLTGQPPFAGRTPQRMMAAHMSEKPQPVSELRPEVPPALAALIMRCLEKEASARPQSAGEVLAALESATTSDAGRAAMPAILLGGRGMFQKALAVYAAAFIAVAVVAKASIAVVGLPDWVFPGALIVMALGLPMILFTAYTQHVARRALTTSPTYTPGGSPVMAHGTMATMAMKASPHLSWRRTTMGGIYAVGGFIALIGVFMALRAFGIGPAGSLLAAGRLSNKDVLIVSDFRVKGADSSLGPVVSEAVRTQLGQSGVVSVLNPATVAAALRRMQKPPTSQLDLALAREVGQREGAKAIVDGDLTPLGAGFILSMRLVTVDSQAELASFHETANGPKDLLTTLDKLVRSLRGKMGESLKQVHSDPPLEQVTTPSLEALRRFAEGRRANNVEGNFAKSVKLLEEAVALDTTFASAYRSLGIGYANLNYPREKLDSAFARAYRYRDRLTEKERLLATAAFFGGPLRDRAREIAAFDEYMARYPDDYTAPNNSGLRFMTRRQFARADSLFRRSIAIDSNVVLAYGNLLRALVSEGKLDEADKINADMHRRFPNSPATINAETPILYARGMVDSLAATLRRTVATTSNAQTKANSLNLLAGLALTAGRLAESQRLRFESSAANRARGAAISPLIDAVDLAWVDAWFRAQPERAVQRLDSALAATPLKMLAVDTRGDFRIAGVYAIAGRPDRARAVIAGFDADIRDTTVRRSFEPARHGALAEIAIAEHRARDAINEVRLSDQLPDGPADACGTCFYANLGRAFDLAEMPDSAIATFERSLSTPFWNRYQLRGDPTNLAGTYKRLGELYEAKGDKQKAASYYTKFVDLWKSADPELQPRVAEVRRKLARLGDAESRR